MFDLHHLHRRLEAAASHFDSADFVAAATRNGLLERLDGLRVDAATVLDLGCATGSATAGLTKRFGRPQIIAVDVADGMLRAARRKKPWRSRTGFVRADAGALPLADDSVDVVFSNLLLPYVAEPRWVFIEVARVLRPDGLFAFATLGPDSFAELAAARGDDGAASVRGFPDMHDLGDALVRAQLGDPVLDVDRLQVEYDTTARLYADLTAVGARNSLAGRAAGLAGRRPLAAAEKRLRERAAGGAIRLELELVYGHAWGRPKPNDPAAFRIDPGGIPLRRRN